MGKTHLALCIAAALCAPFPANAAVVAEAEPNDTRATAQNLSNSFSGESVVNIFNSTTVPHASVTATNGSADDVDYYAITVAAPGQTAFFDIDGAEGLGGQESNLHTALALFDAAGNLLAFDVSSEVDPGSIAPNSGGSGDSDSFIGRYTFTAAGTYYVGVTNGRFFETDPASYLSATGTLVGPLVRPDGQGGGERYAGDSGPVTMTSSQAFDSGTYTLHVSLTAVPPPASPIPIPFAALGLTVLGLAGFGMYRLRRSTG